MHTLEGWLLINITPESINITDTTAKDYSKIELIFEEKNAKDDDLHLPKNIKRVAFACARGTVIGRKNI